MCTWCQFYNKIHSFSLVYCALASLRIDERMENWKCFLCFSEFIELEHVIGHLRKEHGVKQKVNEIKCVANNAACQKTFQTWCGFRKHILNCRKVRNKQKNSNNIIDNNNINNDIHVETSSNISWSDNVQDVNVRCDKISIIISTDHIGNGKECATVESADDEEEVSDLHVRMMTSVKHCTDKIELLGVTGNVKNSIYSLIEDMLSENYAFTQV